MDDFEIIKLYFSRSERAIEETKNKYDGLCYSVAYNMLRDKEDSEECVNDTYLGAWNAIPPKKPNNFKAFLCKITRNLALKRIDYNSAQKRNPDLLISLDQLEAILPDNMADSEVDDKFLGQLISTFLKSEKYESRIVFIRKYWFFDSIHDIALKYGFSEGKVKSMLHRTKNRLKEYLKKEGVNI